MRDAERDPEDRTRAEDTERDAAEARPAAARARIDLSVVERQARHRATHAVGVRGQIVDVRAVVRHVDATDRHVFAIEECERYGVARDGIGLRRELDRRHEAAAVDRYVACRELCGNVRLRGDRAEQRHGGRRRQRNDRACDDCDDCKRAARGLRKATHGGPRSAPALRLPATLGHSGSQTLRVDDVGGFTEGATVAGI